MIINTPEWVTASGAVHKETGELETLVSTVYEPAEDTFLILDALQLDLEKTVCDRLRCADSSSSKCGPLLVVELGSGAGIIATAVAKALSLSGAPFAVGTHCVAVDSNPAACRVTAQTCKLNNVEVDVVHGDLLTWMRHPISLSKENTNVYGIIDVMIFNPPYVRGPNGEHAPMPIIPKMDQNDKFISTLGDVSWLGGGPDGIDVLKRALHQAADHLSERGVFYVLMIDYNYTALVEEEILAQSKRTDERPIFQKNSMDYVLFTTFGKNPKNTPLACHRILSRQVPGERLAVYCVYRPHINMFMDKDNLTTATIAPVRNTAGNNSPDDDDLDEATRDTLAEGLVAQLLRPCIDRLDASVQCTRLSQLNLKLQLDSLAAELKGLSLAQHDYLRTSTSMFLPGISATANKTVSTVIKTTTDTCVLLDSYAQRLCSARAKIAVVGNILESTQERLRALSHRIGREHNNRRSLLEPQVAAASSITAADNEEIKHQLKNQENKIHEQPINDDSRTQASSEP